jgi:hypothetical protein
VVRWRNEMLPMSSLRQAGLLGGRMRRLIGLLWITCKTCLAPADAEPLKRMLGIWTWPRSAPRRHARTSRRLAVSPVPSSSQPWRPDFRYSSMRCGPRQQLAL